MLIYVHVLNFLLMILLPILLGIWVVRKTGLSWKLLLAGALTFIASQVLHIPLVYGLTAAFQNNLLPDIPETWAPLFNAVVLGLLAGIFEETARWILYKFFLKKAITWEAGVVVGAGHGGIEALLLGLAAAVAFVQLMGFRSVDPATLSNLPAAQVDAIRQAVAAYWSIPAYDALLGFVERVFAICLHLSLSVMVLYAVVGRKPVWFWLALLWHAFVDGVAVFLVGKISNLALEGIIGVMAVISLGILFSLRPRFPKGEAVEAASSPSI